MLHLGCVMSMPQSSLLKADDANVCMLSHSMKQIALPCGYKIVSAILQADRMTSGLDQYKTLFSDPSQRQQPAKLIKHQLQATSYHEFRAVTEHLLCQSVATYGT